MAGGARPGARGQSSLIRALLLAATLALAIAPPAALAQPVCAVQGVDAVDGFDPVMWDAWTTVGERLEAANRAAGSSPACLAARTSG
jgi:hypothetical protein